MGSPGCQLDDGEWASDNRGLCFSRNVTRWVVRYLVFTKLPREHVHEGLGEIPLPHCLESIPLMHMRSKACQ